MPRPDPDSQTSVKHFLIALQAGAAPVNLLAVNPSRNYLYVINNGVNSGAFWFDQANNTGQAIVLGPGSTQEYDAKVPINRVFFQSTLGTIFAVVEGYGVPGERP